MHSGKEAVTVLGVGGAEQSLGRGQRVGLGFVRTSSTSIPALCLTLSPLKSKAAGPVPASVCRAIVLCLSRRYFENLLQLKGRSREAGAEFLSWNDIQDSVSNTNSSVQDENDRESCSCGVGLSRGSSRLSRREITWGTQPQQDTREPQAALGL